MSRRRLARAAPGLALVLALVAGGIVGNTLLLAQADDTLQVGRLSSRLPPTAPPSTTTGQTVPPTSEPAAPATTQRPAPLTDEESSGAGSPGAHEAPAAASELEGADD